MGDMKGRFCGVFFRVFGNPVAPKGALVCGRAVQRGAFARLGTARSRSESQAGDTLAGALGVSREHTTWTSVGAQRRL